VVQIKIGNGIAIKNIKDDEYVNGRANKKLEY